MSLIICWISPMGRWYIVLTELYLSAFKSVFENTLYYAFHFSNVINIDQDVSYYMSLLHPYASAQIAQSVASSSLIHDH